MQSSRTGPEAGGRCSPPSSLMGVPHPTRSPLVSLQHLAQSICFLHLCLPTGAPLHDRGDLSHFIQIPQCSSTRAQAQEPHPRRQAPLRSRASQENTGGVWCGNMGNVHCPEIKNFLWEKTVKSPALLPGRVSAEERIPMSSFPRVRVLFFCFSVTSLANNILDGFAWLGFGGANISLSLHRLTLIPLRLTLSFHQDHRGRGG